MQGRLGSALHAWSWITARCASVVYACDVYKGVVVSRAEVRKMVRCKGGSQHSSSYGLENGFMAHDVFRPVVNNGCPCCCGHASSGVGEDVDAVTAALREVHCN